MKLIIAGSRTVGPTVAEIDAAARDVIAPDHSEDIYRLLRDDVQLVSGTATGADQAGERWAAVHQVRVKRFPADWQKHGKAAGPIRNRAMAAYADAALIFWDGESRGSANMIAEMERLGKPVRVVRVPRKVGGE